MLRDIFPRRSRQGKGPATGAGERIYAIGDIHGRADLFRKLLRNILMDGRSRERISTQIILLGDLVDRGPDSREVLKLARRFQSDMEAFVVLGGNHEQMLLESAGGHGTMQNVWLDNGGLATLKSFGIDVDAARAASPLEFAKMLHRNIGRSTLTWLRELPHSYRSGDYFFCHAGVRPGVAIEQQRNEDLLWIRSDFLDSDADHGAIVVHGHSEGHLIEEEPNRINLDTAAYRTGCLSAIGLEGENRWFLQASDRD